MPTKFYAHPTTYVSPEAVIGDGTQIWHQSQIRELSVIGTNCVIGKDVYVDYKVQIGNNVKIQNGVSVYQGVTLEDGVFCGPHCVFTNDIRPRAITPDGVLKTTNEWRLTSTLVRRGASIGAHATIVCGVTIGEWAMIGAGAVVTRDVPDHGLVYGTPARLRGFVCPCGNHLSDATDPLDGELATLECSSCQRAVAVNMEDYVSMLRNRTQQQTAATGAY